VCGGRSECVLGVLGVRVGVEGMIIRDVMSSGIRDPRVRG